MVDFIHFSIYFLNVYTIHYLWMSRESTLINLSQSTQTAFRPPLLIRRKYLKYLVKISRNYLQYQNLTFFYIHLHPSWTPSSLFSLLFLQFPKFLKPENFWWWLWYCVLQQHFQFIWSDISTILSKFIMLGCSRQLFFLLILTFGSKETRVDKQLGYCTSDPEEYYRSFETRHEV